MPLVEVIRNGQVVITETQKAHDDQDEVPAHIQVRGRHKTRLRLAPESEAALIREIQRCCPDWQPTPEA